MALDRSLSILKEFAAAVRWADRVGKIGEFAPEADYLYGEAGRLRTDSGQFLSRARLNTIANRRSHEHARFRALDGGYRDAFRNWAGRTKPCKVSQSACARRELEDGKDTGNVIEFIYHESRNRPTEFMLGQESKAGSPVHST